MRGWGPVRAVCRAVDRENALHSFVRRHAIPVAAMAGLVGTALVADLAVAGHEAGPVAVRLAVGTDMMGLLFAAMPVAYTAILSRHDRWRRAGIASRAAAMCYAATGLAAATAGGVMALTGSPVDATTAMFVVAGFAVPSTIGAEVIGAVL